MGPSQVTTPYIHSIIHEYHIIVESILKTFFSAESTRPCNGTMDERISSRKASIGGLTTGSSRSTAPILRSLGMRATGGSDVPRLGDSQVLCLLTRASQGGASSLPRRRRIPMVLWEMKILMWRVVTLKQPVVILFDLILYSILSPSFVETKEYYIYAKLLNMYIYNTIYKHRC